VFTLLLPLLADPKKTTCWLIWYYDLPNGNNHVVLCTSNQLKDAWGDIKGYQSSPTTTCPTKMLRCLVAMHLFPGSGHFISQGVVSTVDDVMPTILTNPTHPVGAHRPGTLVATMCSSFSRENGHPKCTWMLITIRINPDMVDMWIKERWLRRLAKELVPSLGWPRLRSL